MIPFIMMALSLAQKKQQQNQADNEREEKQHYAHSKCNYTKWDAFTNLKTNEAVLNK